MIGIRFTGGVLVEPPSVDCVPRSHHTARLRVRAAIKISISDYI